MFVVPTIGGTPRQVAKELGWVANPLWSPDGKQLLVASMQGPNAVDTFGYSLVSFEGGAIIPTDIMTVLAKHHVRLPSEDISLDWSGSGLLLAAETEVWTFRLDQQTGRVLDLRRLISGTAEVSEIRGQPDRFVFSSTTSAYHLWRLPVDSNSARVGGPLTLIPHTGRSQSYPSYSRDGKKLVYLQTSPSGSEVRLRDYISGKELVLSSQYVRPIISPGGSHIAYTPLNQGPSGGLYLLDAAGGEAKPLVPPSETATVYGWSRDGTKVVFWDGTPIRFSTLDWRTGQRDILIAHPKYNIHDAELSPDDKWVAFHLVDPARRNALIAPVRHGKAAAESEWITIATDATTVNRRPWWSDDGNLLYFISGRDGKECIWAQHLDPRTKRPSGDAFAVVHFHASGRSLILTGAPSGPAVSSNELVFGLLERKGDIWMAEEPSSR